MKRFWIAFLVLCVSCFTLAADEVEESNHPWAFHSEFGLYLDLKAGAEYRFSDLFGVRGSLGVCLLSPLEHFAYNLVGVFHLMEPAKPFQLDIQAGLIYANVVLPGSESAYYSIYWNTGACVAVGYRSPKGHVFRFRAGGGLAFGHDLGEWQEPQFMPNIGIEYDYSLWE